MKLDIENFRIVNKPELPKFKALTDIIIDESIMIRDIKLLELNNDLFIAMPSKKIPTGEYKDVCHPIDINCRKEIERAIKENYKYNRYSAGFKEEFKITEVKVKKINSNNELKAVASVLFNNKFVIHDIKLVERVSDDGNQKRFELYMPSKSINEKIVDIAYIVNEKLKSEIFNKIIEQYKGM